MLRPAVKSVDQHHRLIRPRIGLIDAGRAPENRFIDAGFLKRKARSLALRLYAERGGHEDDHCGKHNV